VGLGLTRPPGYHVEVTEPEQPLSRRALREAEAARGRRRRGAHDSAAPAAESAGSAATGLGASVAGAAELPPTAPTELLGADQQSVDDQVADAQTAEASASAESSKKRGLGAWVREHPRAVLTTSLIALFALLGTGALWAGIAVGSAEAAPAPIVTETPTPEPDPRPLPASAIDPSRLRTCSVVPIARDDNFKKLYVSIMNADTGEILFERRGTEAARTGSVLKVVTAAAALSVLGPDYRMTTRVVAGSQPGTVVLVGGGDATLSRLPSGQESIYRGAPKLSDLAAQTVAAYAAANPDEPGITQLVLDSTYWNPADNWHDTWNRDRIPAGYQAPATALMVDGDRADPRAQTSARSTDPIERAGREFAQALANAGNPAGVPAISRGASVGGSVLGEVKSQPVSTLIAQMLPNSDNTLGEMLARVTSKQMGLDGSTASLTQAITGALNVYGVDTRDLVIKDGSGLATDNAVPPRFMAQLFAVIATGDRNLSIITDSLPVAGQSGTLAGRFTGSNAIARGAVIAKTGWLRSAYSLSGIIKADDGTTLTFAVYSVRDGIPESVKTSHDTLIAGAFTCGDNLSNN